jgi:hypothetical protein
MGRGWPKQGDPAPAASGDGVSGCGFTLRGGQELELEIEVTSVLEPELFKWQLFEH